MTQLIFDKDREFPRNENDHEWTTVRLADEFFLRLCLYKKYYKQAKALMFRIPFTGQYPKTEEEAVPFVIDFKDLSTKVQDEFSEYCKLYSKQQIRIFLKEVVIRLFENLDYSYAHMSIMKKLRVRLSC